MIFAFFAAALSPEQNTQALALMDIQSRASKLHIECMFKQPAILDNFWKPTDSAADVAEASFENCSREDGTRWQALYDFYVFTQKPDPLEVTNQESAVRKQDLRTGLITYIFNARAIAAGKK